MKSTPHELHFELKVSKYHFATISMLFNRSNFDPQGIPQKKNIKKATITVAFFIDDVIITI